MVLVAGATGALGGMIAHRLLAEGRQVRVLVRAGSDYAALVEAQAEPVIGDLKDPASLRRACAGVDVVITTANSARRGGDDTVDAIERTGNRNLIDAAKQAGVRRFVFVSALGADPNAPVDFLRAKGEAEGYLRASGLEYVILEPNLFVEVWVGMLVAGPVMAGQPVTLVRDARARHAFVSMDDVADLAVATVDHPEAANQTIILGGPAALSWRDVVAVFERVLGRSIEIRLVEPGDPLPGLPDVVSQLAAAFETHETVIESSGIVRTFSLQPHTVDDFARSLGRRAAAADT